jgi:alkaline phosphatase
MRKSRSWKNLPATWALVVCCACLPFSKALAESPQDWYRQGQSAVRQARNLKINNRVAQNVILFIGDGMNLPTVTAARILEGQSLGKKGEEHVLSFEKLPYVALAKTYCTNAQVTDSAAAMTAIITGVKTKAGVLSVNQKVTPHKASTVPGNELLTLFEIAEQRGLSTGVVTTTTVTHATPAACYAHSPDRDWEGDADIKIADDPANAAFPDIARQLIEFPHGNGLEVALGGGRQFFLPETAPDPEYPAKFGKRKDGRNLTREWVHKYAGAAYVWNQAQFDAINPATTRHLLGLFEPSHMRYEKDRAQDAAGEPSLSAMTAKAIDILAKNRKGYVLMVEGGRIDHAHHDNNAYNALHDTVEFAKAVQVALDKTNPKDTLIVVTADHGHVMCFSGYPTRGNPILGKVVGNDYWGDPTTILSLGSDNLPYTTLLYGTGPGYKNPRPDLTAVDTTAPAYQQQAAVPRGSDTHSGEDVAIYAGGPGAYLFHGVQEESYIFHAIQAAMQLKDR